MTANTRIGVIGAGTMGRGIAQTAAVGGFLVTLQDVREQALQDALDAVGRDLSKAVDRGTYSQEESQAIHARLTSATDPADLSGCDIVIEAVSENLELKRTVLRTVEESVAPETLLATNTSSIPVTAIGSALSDASRLLGMHFFNPVPRMALVELVPTVATAETALSRAEEFVKALGKTPIVAQDRPGFVVNALLVPFLLSAARMLDYGYAPAATIDEGMRLGASHPMGPLALSDLIGLDVLCDVADSMYRETADPALIVPSSLRRMVEAGDTGRKSGRGYYSY